jgi:ATP-dependent Clp protease adaptor protein ClpS
MVREKTKPVHNQQEKLDDPHQLILFNDEINSFDFVIETLVDVCKHDPIQAEQCTWIAHFKGQCAIKEGSLKELKPIRAEMERRGLTVSIEK